MLCQKGSTWISRSKVFSDLMVLCLSIALSIMDVLFYFGRTVSDALAWSLANYNLFTEA